MKLLCMFGIRDKSIFRMNCQTNGIITEIKKFWWVKIKTKPARLYASAENTVYPHVISFQYEVAGVTYTGHRYIPIQYRVPQKGEKICVYFDPENAKKYACHALGPGITKIEW